MHGKLAVNKEVIIAHLKRCSRWPIFAFIGDFLQFKKRMDEIAPISEVPT
jgi:hypothetical protein